jgi:hypothetical protein
MTAPCSVSALDGAALHAYQLHMAAHAAFKLTLRGDGNRRAFEWFQQTPQPGEMVFESGSAWLAFRRNPGRSLLAVGTLVRIAHEPYPGEWGDEKPPLERVYYIQNLDGIERRWTNAEFRRVPQSPEPWGE